jgi:hypothetical protein
VVLSASPAFLREGEEPMNRAIVCAIGVCLALPVSAFAAFNFNFELTGTIMHTPAEYSGPLTSGADGSFTFGLVDTGWPDSTSQSARWDYIFTTYFADNYDNTTPGAYCWKGNIEGYYALVIMNAPPGFNGSVSGDFLPQITLRDIDEDGIFDPFEREGDNLINGSFTIVCGVGTGEIECRRGFGSMQSNYMSFPFLPQIDEMPSGSGSMSLFDCPSSTEPSSWGNIKALYR